MNNKKLAEFIGIILGDGHLHKKQNTITIVGSLEDIHYYKKIVSPLIEELFDIKPTIKRRKDRNAYYIYFNSKKTMDYLTKEIGLIRGNKINAIIPRLISKDKKLILHFLRGLFDTDGCLKFSKQLKEVNYYPRIRLAFRESNFTLEIKELISKMDFNFSMWKSDRFNGGVIYERSGNKNLEKWFKIIKPNNPVHTSKYYFWKKYGHYIPRSSLKSRINSLNLKIDTFH